MYRDPHRSPDGRTDQVYIAQQLWSADCTHNAIASLQSSYFNATGAPLGAYVAPSPERISVNPSGHTIAAGMLSLLCARPFEFDDEWDYVTDADAATLRKMWLLLATPAPSAPAQAPASP